jgi:hypothetical protein
MLLPPHIGSPRFSFDGEPGSDYATFDYVEHPDAF